VEPIKAKGNGQAKRPFRLEELRAVLEVADPEWRSIDLKPQGSENLNINNQAGFWLRSEPRFLLAEALESVLSSEIVQTINQNNLPKGSR
jgi:hypothetical protein